MKLPLALLLLFTALPAASAQDSTAVAPAPAPAPTPAVRPRLVTLRDWQPFGLVVAGAALLSPLDREVATRLQQSALQSNAGVHHVADIVRVAGDPGALIGSASLFVVARLAHNAGLADAGLHATESIAASGIITQFLKNVVGRGRPIAVGGANPYVFHPLHGRQAGYNSFPSGHATAAFAAATAFSEELRRSHPGAAARVSPVFYGLATLVAASRLYDNKHWLSDVVMGAGIGTLTAHRIVTYTHAVPASRLNTLRPEPRNRADDVGVPVLELHRTFR